ncbi:MAG: ClcB-like voltage-gated chloride channel protein [Verrucomicrobiales bacterium]|nr:ClcB-like voltage-gated chloride channel protein [Verrucomicrobiales bacterium]
MNAGLERWKHLRRWARRLFQRHRDQLLELRQRWRPREETFHLVLAAAIGIIAGLTNYAFHLGTESAKRVLLHRPGDLVEIAEGLHPWMRILVPTLGGLAAGFVLQYGLRAIRRQTTTNLLEVVVAGDGRIPFRTSLIKVLSSLLSIASGASIGREGSVVQLSSMLASQGGQAFRWPPYRLRLMVACGAAAGIAAAYNAPVAGAVFAAQIVLGNFSMHLFGPLVCASVVAAMVSRTFFGLEPLYQVPEFDFQRVMQLPWFLVLGALAGAVGAAFLKLLDWSERAFKRVVPPVYARLALAGAVVGTTAIWFPEVWGNGYAATSRILGAHEGYTLWFLMGLFVAKLGCTVITVGAGTVGGVFTPTLFVGAALGSVFANVLRALGWIDPEVPVAVFALVGMGSVLAATTHSPLLAMIIVFEISVNYSLMPPLMLACAVGTVVGQRLHQASVYTEPLRLKGILPEETSRLGGALEKTVADLLQEPVPPLRETAPLREVSDRFLRTPVNFLPVVNEGGRLLGVIALQDLKEYLNAAQADALRIFIASDLMRPAPRCLTPSQRLRDVLPALLGSEARRIPVVNNLTEFKLIGVLHRNEALAMLSEAISARRS